MKMFPKIKKLVFVQLQKKTPWELVKDSSGAIAKLVVNLADASAKKKTFCAIPNAIVHRGEC